MLALRAISPTDLTPRLLDVLTGHPGATNIVLLPRAAVDPPGDLVLADIAREATSEVVEAVRALPGGRSCSLALETIDTSLSEQADRAEREAPGLGIDAVVWEEVEARTSEESALSGSFLTLLVIAVLLAAVGLLVDSAILVIGAMVVGPEFGAVAGLTVAVVTRQWELGRRSLRALAVGFPLAVVAAYLLTLAVAGTVGLPAAYSGPRPATGFVHQPDAFTVVVALLAGVAGVVSLTSTKSAGLVGVAVSVTTVPAAAGIGVAAAAGRWGECLGSVVQLTVNLVALVLAGVLTLTIRRALSHRARRAATAGS